MRDIFIAGSGRSILDITEEEKGYVNSSDFILVFNKFPIFMKKSGIVPTHYLFLEEHFPASRVLVGALRSIIDGKLDDMSLYIHSGWEDTIRMGVTSLCRNCIKNILCKCLYRGEMSACGDDGNGVSGGRGKSLVPASSKLKGHDKKALSLKDMFFLLRNKKNILERTVFVNNSHWLEGGGWARNIKDDLFHYRGTLTDAVNLASVLNPGRKIKLLGVDLDNYGYFFQDELENSRKDLLDWTDEISRKNGVHITILPVRGKEGIQKSIPGVIENLEKSGNSLACCNPESFLVKKGLVEYEPVINTERTSEKDE